MNKRIIIIASVFGILAVSLGAFGAHALKKTLTEAQLQSFEVGVRYQMYHALFLLFIGAFTLLNEKERFVIFWLTISGVLFFSGSIYLLATNGITNLKTKWLTHHQKMLMGLYIVLQIKQQVIFIMVVNLFTLLPSLL